MRSVRTRKEEVECLPTIGSLNGEDGGSSLIEDSGRVTCQPQYPAEIYQLA